jgi:hypothetical protein
MNKKIKNKSGGYTLMELVLYISLSAMMLFVISTMMFNFFEARIKNQTISEVAGEGVQVIQVINEAISDATSVNSPTVGSNNTVLSLNVSDPLKSPTVFSLSGGEVIMTEGLNPPVTLTNNLQTNVSNILFENLSRSLTTDSIGFSFSIFLIVFYLNLFYFC